MRELTVLIIILVCVAFTSGCTARTSSQTTTPPATQVATQAVTQAVTLTSNGIVKNVYIRNRAFEPDIITISPGTTVTWINGDSVSHRVVHLPTEATAKELFYSEPIVKGGSFSYTFQTAGRYYYADPQFAGGRKSTVIVE